jgi:hypothetical protein
VVRFRTARCPARVQDRWREQSLAKVWPADPAEWHTPAVDAICDAFFFDATRLQASCRLLGEHRAHIGVPLDDARADIAVGARAVRAAELVQAQAVDALTLGWTTYIVDHLVARAARDPLTEFASLGYLVSRLDEIYAEAALNEESVAETYVLVVVGTRPAPDRLVAQTRMITLNSALRYAFVGGETLVSIGGARVVALTVRAQPRLSDSLAVLRSELRIARSERRLPATRLWLLQLPRQRTELGATLRDLLA